MQVKELNTDGLSRTYSVTIPKEDLAEKLEAKIKEMQPQVSLKGFRPGKVPVAHIRKMFGASIMRDVVEDTVNESSQKAINDNSIRPAGQPKIDLRANGDDVTNGKADLEYQMTVEIIPEFDPVDPESLKFTRLTCAVADTDVEERLTKLSEGQKTYKKKAKTAKAKKDDAVLINFTGRVDGEAFDGGAMEGHQLVLGSGTEVLEVQGAKDAELDDDLAKKFGMEDLEALKTAVKEQAEAEFDAQSKMKLKRAILDELDKKHDFELPQGMVEAEFNNIWQQVESEKAAGQLDEEDAAKSEDDLKADYRKIAERRVRLGLVLADMGQKAEITISNEELQGAMIAEARRYPGQEQQVIEFYQKNPQMLAQLRAPIYEEKVVELITEKAEIKDKKVKQEKLFEEDDMI